MSEEDKHRPKRAIESRVKGHEGWCKPTWINQNQLDNRVDGGYTGFFRRVKKVWIFWIKTGPEFHGIIKWGTNYVQ